MILSTEVQVQQRCACGSAPSTDISFVYENRLYAFLRQIVGYEGSRDSTTEYDYLTGFIVFERWSRLNGRFFRSQKETSRP